MKESYINDRQGRVQGSDAAAHYVARFGGRAEDEYARMHGIEVDQDEPEPIGPVKCPRHEPACVHCQQVLDHGVVQSIEEDEREIRSAFFRFARENPGVLDDYQNSRDFTELLEDNPALFEDAQEFIEVLTES